MLRFFLKAAGVVLVLSLLVFTLILARVSTTSPGSGGLRAELDRYPTLRGIFRLHSYGDGKTDYLLSKYKQIKLEIDYLPGYAPSEAMRLNLDKDLEALTGKTVSSFLSDEISSGENNTERYNETELSSLESKYRSTHTSGQTAALYMLVVTKSSEHPTNVGETMDENSFVMFDQEIQELPTYSTDELKLEESTALHEFGHLLGLEHSSSGVMEAQVEVSGGQIDPSNYWFSAGDLARIRSLRQKYAT
jgi:hypothetical protein